MADDFIDKLRTASFPTARRGGYETEAVDSYLRELADWLETGGTDQTRATLIRRELESVGERTGTILAAAQESAEGILEEARTEATEVREAARREAAEARSSADQYAAETRRAADEHVRISAEAAAREASELRTRAEAEAQEKVGKADARLREAEEEARERTAGVEREIADLVKTRESIVENLESLRSGIRGVVDGPGGEELEIPEAISGAIERAGQEPGEGRFDPEAAQEHRLPEPDDDTVPVEDGSEDDTAPVEDGSEDATAPFGDDPRLDEAEGETTVMVDEFDTDERERAREQELERRRHREGTDPPIEESDPSDPLL